MPDATTQLKGNTMAREPELKAILNTAEFGTKEWDTASDELYSLRARDIKENPAQPLNLKHNAYLPVSGRWV